MGGRYEEHVQFGSGGERITLTVTRKGIEVHGVYDSFVGIEGGSIPWSELEAMRKRVMEVRPTAYPDPLDDTA